MVHFVNSHGVETIIAFYVFTCIVGGMPPLPADAGYWAKWGFAILHALAGNLKQVSQILQLPDMPASH
jgi:hypothetical protein